MKKIKSFQQIEFLLVIGSILYLALGFLLLSRDISSWENYFGFIIVFFVTFLFGFIAHYGKFSHKLSSSIFLVTNHAALVNVYFFFPKNLSENEHVFCSALLLVAVVDAVVVMNRTIMYLSNLATTLITLVAIFLTPSFQHDYIVGTIILLLTWKIVVAGRLQNSFSQTLKARQLEAFRATVVALSHEFNNIAGICQALFVKIKSTNEGGILEASDLDILDRSLDRLVTSIRKIKKLETYEEVEYLRETKMVDITK